MALQEARIGRPSALAAEVTERIVRERNAGATWEAIGLGLDRAGVRTGHGGRRWYPSTVRRVYFSQASTPAPEPRAKSTEEFDVVLPAAVAGLFGPQLPGAACAGQAPRFDPEIPGETTQERIRRLAIVRRTCAGCPIRHACHAAAVSIPRRHRSGVWAGRQYG